MKTGSEKMKCPENEVLSLYLDGLISEESPESVHISSCSACLEKINSYSAIDKTIDKALSGSSDADFAERIIGKVRNELAKKTNTLSFPYMLARAASVLFVLSASVFFVNSIYTPSENFSSEYATEKKTVPETVAKNTVVNTQVLPANLAETPLQASPALYSNSVSMDNMALASTGSPKVYFSEELDNEPARIQKIVHHVWAVKDIDASKAKLQKVISEASSQEDLRSRKKGDTTEKFVLKKLDKSTLVGLIKKLSDEGFTLISPEQPQPENNVFHGKATEPVRYYFDLVRS